MTDKLDRRTFIVLSGAAVAAAAMPSAAPSAAAAIAKLPAAPMPTWIVGTPGEADHEVIRAATREAAIRFRAEECELDPDDDDFVGDGSCDCCACSANAGYEATRVPAWDGRSRQSIGDADWLRQGFDANCARCGDIANADDDGHVVEDKAVCGGCMTRADRFLIDPELAAEMYGEAAA